MIIIVNGAIGCGKTSVSWALLRHFERAAMIDGDFMAAVEPFSIFEQSNLEYAYRSIAQQLYFHLENGYQNLIINYVLETPGELHKMKTLLGNSGLPIYSFLLTCEKEVREARIRDRASANTDLEWELSRSADLDRILWASYQEGGMGGAVDTTSLTLDEVASRIISHIKTTSHGD